MNNLTYHYGSCTPEQLAILRDKATEPPFSGKWQDKQGLGSFLCRGCGLALYRADAQFLSQCGWPSFDAEIEGAIKRQMDVDGHRTEILCQRCDGHMGHVFMGEHYTDKDIRHCVNALAIDFVNSQSVEDAGEAIVAGGCFWGLDYLFSQWPGVVLTEVGYTGGDVDQPSYDAVCVGGTGHVEAVRILFDKAQTSYSEIIKTFFEMHDPTQANGQGPDIGSQYHSAIVIYHDAQKEVAEYWMRALAKQSVQVATKLLPPSVFWPAEEYHQAYYKKHKGAPYCHVYTKRF